MRIIHICWHSSTSVIILWSYKREVCNCHRRFFHSTNNCRGLPLVKLELTTLSNVDERGADFLEERLRSHEVETIVSWRRAPLAVKWLLSCSYIVHVWITSRWTFSIDRSWRHDQQFHETSQPEIIMKQRMEIAWNSIEYRVLGFTMSCSSVSFYRQAKPFKKERRDL